MDRKVRPVPTYFPDPRAQEFKEIPPAVLLELPTHPSNYHNLDFSGRVTLERLEGMLDSIEPGALTPDETNLIAFVVVKRGKAFAWNYAEKGYFSREYYPDYEIPTIEHVPWQANPIKIPNAIYDVIAVIQDNEAAGRFEPTTSSYRSSLFAVAKKPGSVPPVRLVIDMQPLNAVTIRDSSLVPNLNEFAESFLGHAMYGLLDMFSGFDARWCGVRSRPLQAFHAPGGGRQQTTIVQGYTNSMQEFQGSTKHGIKRISPHIADNFIDDLGVKGPRSRYNNEVIPGNPNIRRYVFEYIQNLDEFLGTIINVGITASGKKCVLATTKLKIVGSVVSLDGWIIAPSVVQKVLDWPVPQDLTDVRGFLGTAGGGRRWIKGYSMIAKPLTNLLRLTDTPFEMTTEALEAFELLKHKITRTPVLIVIDYKQAKLILPQPQTSDEGMIVTGVDSAWMGAGWSMNQIRDSQKRIALYGSCTFNKREQNYGQPKTEVYGIF